jgi:hypothetical protein
MEPCLQGLLKDRKRQKSYSYNLERAKIAFYTTHVLPTVFTPQVCATSIEKDDLRDDATDEILSNLSMFQMKEFLKREKMFGTSIYEFCEDEGIDISLTFSSPVNSPDDFSNDNDKDKDTVKVLPFQGIAK